MELSEALLLLVFNLAINFHIRHLIHEIWMCAEAGQVRVRAGQLVHINHAVLVQGRGHVASHDELGMDLRARQQILNLGQSHHRLGTLRALVVRNVEQRLRNFARLIAALVQLGSLGRRWLRQVVHERGRARHCNRSGEYCGGEFTTDLSSELSPITPQSHRIRCTRWDSLWRILLTLRGRERDHRGGVCVGGDLHHRLRLAVGHGVHSGHGLLSDLHVVVREDVVLEGRQRGLRRGLAGDRLRDWHGEHWRSVRSSRGCKGQLDET